MYRLVRRDRGFSAGSAPPSGWGLGGFPGDVAPEDGEGIADVAAPVASGMVEEVGEPEAGPLLRSLAVRLDPALDGLTAPVVVACSGGADSLGLLVLAHVAGLDPARLPNPPEGVVVSGRLDREAYRELLRRSRVFVTAPRREDHGIAQLEAIADGCVLVTTAAPGPYAALPIARELDQRLVGDDLASGLRMALDDPAPRYTARSIDLIAPFSRAAVDHIVAGELLPRLLA